MRLRSLIDWSMARMLLRLSGIVDRGASSFYSPKWHRLGSTRPSVLRNRARRRAVRLLMLPHLLAWHTLLLLPRLILMSVVSRRCWIYVSGLRRSISLGRRRRISLAWRRITSRLRLVFRDTWCGAHEWLVGARCCVRCILLGLAVSEDQEDNCEGEGS